MYKKVSLFLLAASFSADCFGAAVPEVNVRQRKGSTFNNPAARQVINTTPGKTQEMQILTQPSPCSDTATAGSPDPQDLKTIKDSFLASRKEPSPSPGSSHIKKPRHNRRKISSDFSSPSPQGDPVSRRTLHISPGGLFGGSSPENYIETLENLGKEKIEHVTRSLVDALAAEAPKSLTLTPRSKTQSPSLLELDEATTRNALELTALEEVVSTLANTISLTELLERAELTKLAQVEQIAVDEAAARKLILEEEEVSTLNLQRLAELEPRQEEPSAQNVARRLEDDLIPRSAANEHFSQPQVVESARDEADELGLPEKQKRSTANSQPTPVGQVVDPVGQDQTTSSSLPNSPAPTAQNPESQKASDTSRITSPILSVASVVLPTWLVWKFRHQIVKSGTLGIMAATAGSASATTAIDFFGKKKKIKK